MKKITFHLWYNKEAKKAAEFYTSTFKDSKIKNISTIHNTPSGSVDIVTIEILGQEFTLISAGPLFKFNPSVSFTVNCESVEEVDSLWEKISEKGTALMELGEYPFSKRYGWLKDKYGVSWQLILREDKQKIIPSLLFVQENNGKAKEAIEFYTSIFKNSRFVESAEYEEGEGSTPGHLKYARFTLEGKDFIAMDGGLSHKFTFNEAISFIVHCSTQKEIDYYWEKLSAVPESEQCGWLKDKYGVSWQIVPTILGELMKKKPKQVTEAFLKMKKFNIAELEKAAEEE